MRGAPSASRSQEVACDRLEARERRQRERFGTWSPARARRERAGARAGNISPATKANI